MLHTKSDIPHTWLERRGRVLIIRIRISKKCQPQAWQDLPTCQLSRDLLKGQQSKYPKTRTYDRSQLSMNFNKKDPVEQAFPTFQSNLNPLRYQKVLFREAFVFPVLIQYHSQYSISAVIQTDTSTRQPYLLRQL